MTNKTKRRSTFPIFTLGLLGAGFFLGSEYLPKTQESTPSAIVTQDTRNEDYTPSKGSTVENDFGYRKDDIWYIRREIVENLEAKNVTSEDARDLMKIALEDEHWIVQNSALNELIDAYKKNGRNSYTDVNLGNLSSLKRSHPSIDNSLNKLSAYQK